MLADRQTDTLVAALPLLYRGQTNDRPRLGRGSWPGDASHWLDMAVDDRLSAACRVAHGARLTFGTVWTRYVPGGGPSSGRDQ